MVVGVLNPLLKPLANAIFTDAFRRAPKHKDNEDTKELVSIITDLEYLYDNIKRRHPETKWKCLRYQLYWLETTKQYMVDGESFTTENDYVVHNFYDAERIMKEIMHDKNDYNGNGILEYVSVAIFETAWANGELTPTHIVMQYVDTECEEPGKGNLYRAEKTFIEENGKEKEIAVLISGTEDTVMEQIKAGATVSIHQKREDYVIYKIITDMSISYYGVEIPKENRK